MESIFAIIHERVSSKSGDVSERKHLVVTGQSATQCISTSALALSCCVLVCFFYSEAYLNRCLR